MGAGTLMLAGLLWAATAPPQSDVVWMKDRAITIPIDFNKERRHEIRDLLLFVSTDQGASWNQEGRASPDKQGFPFYAQNDGVYWFALVVVDQKGKQEPSDLRRMAPGFKVAIDTQPPIVQLRSAERVGNEVTVSWAIVEMNPVEQSFRLEYRAAKDPSAPWTQVQVAPAPEGTIKFPVNIPGSIIVRLSLQDFAENKGQAMKTVGDDAAATTMAMNPPTVNPTPPVTPIVAPGPPPLTPSNPVSGGIVPLQPDPIAPSIAPPVRPDALPVERSNGASASPPVAGTNTPTREPVMNTLTPTGGTAPAAPPRPDMRDVKLINSRQVTFDIKVNRSGPSGVRQAILYMTDDDGRTWKEVTRETRLLDHRVTANIPAEGVYGFYLVLESGAGLSVGPPVDGVTTPQRRVEVDVTPPEVTIYEPAPDPNNREFLILRWSATDKNLSNNQVTLEFANDENGPWQKIADVANTGQYPWKVPQNLPPRVYLKVTARDRAGNEGVAKTAKPQLIDLVKPEGEIGDIAKTTIQNPR